MNDDILQNWLASSPFAAANAVFFLELCARRAGTAAANLTDFLSRRELAGDREKVGQAWAACGLPGAPQVSLPRHVFPISLPEYVVAMLVPLHFRAAEEWSAPDVLAGLGPDSPVDGLMRLLGVVEQTWMRHASHRPLPLRWRRPFAVSADCHVHFHRIDERSFELPLLIALLRELCASPVPFQTTRQMPFGDGPVFASGSIRDDGNIGGAGALLLKLEAFVREAPPNSPAVLTPDQNASLRDSPVGRELLDRIQLVTAPDIAHLLDLDVFHDGLELFTGGPRPGELDELLSNMDRLVRSVRFVDAAAIAEWLEPHVTSPCYRARLLMHASAALLHAGRNRQADVYSRQIREVIVSPDLGSEQRVRAAALLASQSVDDADPEEGLELLSQVEPELQWCSAATRAPLLGSKSRLLRALEHWDDAVEAAESAVDLAMRAAAHEAGIDINFLVHALLRRATTVRRSKKGDLARAERLLDESETEWAPVDDANRHAAHLGFCLHLRAEWARVSRRPCEPAAAPAWSGAWGHARLFELLACARNYANYRETRLHYARELVAAVDDFCHDSGTGLFPMLRLVYRVYQRVLENSPFESELQELAAWCEQQADLGAPGWKRRLGSFCRPPTRRDETRWAEKLCDAIPDH